MSEKRTVILGGKVYDLNECDAMVEAWEANRGLWKNKNCIRLHKPFEDFVQGVDALMNDLFFLVAVRA